MLFALVLAFTGTTTPATAEPLPVVEVADGVFAFQGVHAEMNAANRGAIANVGFVIGHDAVAVIDTGGSLVEGRRLLEAVRLRTDLPVKWVVLTHMHPDHVFGTAAFAGPGTAVVAHAHLNAALDARFEHYFEANRAVMGVALLDGVVRLRAAVEVADTTTIDLGGRVLDLVAWPVSHTDNDLTVYDRTTRTLFSGDLVFLGHTPSLDGSLRGWLKTLDRLAQVPALRVVPGHGPVPSPWPAAIEPEKRYLQVLAADVRAAIDAGTPLSAAVAGIGRSEAGKWELFDAFNARNATAAFAELEWE